MVSKVIKYLAGEPTEIASIYMASSREVERSIRFYEIDAGQHDSGTLVPFDHAELLQKIEQLPFTRDPGPSRYEPASRDEVHCAIFEPPGSRDDVKFCRLRRTGLPELECHGRLKNLELRDDEGLAETSHVVFFPGNVAGVEYHRDGPTASDLSWYLTARSGNFLRPIDFRQLVRTDPAKRLAGFGELHELKISIRRPYREVVRSAHPSLGGVLDANEEAVGGGEILHGHLVFDEATRQSGMQRFRQAITILARRPDLGDNALRLQARGKPETGGPTELVDLLGDRIIARKTMFRLAEHGRAVDSRLAFRAIREAYIELHADIVSASSVSFHAAA